jgi:hypothetical protein
MSEHQPAIGEWYTRGGDIFEVVAVDDSDGTVEVQHFDGTVEEFDLDEWMAQRARGDIEDGEAPEDPNGSFDLDVEDNEPQSMSPDLDNDRRSMSGPLDGLDLFE